MNGEDQLQQIWIEITQDQGRLAGVEKSVDQLVDGMQRISETVNEHKQQFVALDGIQKLYDSRCGYVEREIGEMRKLQAKQGEMLADLNVKMATVMHGGGLGAVAIVVYLVLQLAGVDIPAVFAP